MRLISCPKCTSQFDVATMTPGTSFVCGQCRNVLQVPEAGPIIQPLGAAEVQRSTRGRPKPPPTVMMSPDEMKSALRASQDVAAEKSAAPVPAPNPATSRRAARTPRPSRPVGGVKPASRVKPTSGVKPQARTLKPSGRAPAPRRTSRVDPPATAVVPPDQMRKLLAEARGTPAAKPAAPAAKPSASARQSPAKSSPRLPKAMQKRAASSSTQEVAQRAGGSQAVAAPPPANTGKSSRSRKSSSARRERPAREEKKGNTGLIVGIAVGVLALGGGGFFLFGGGGDDGGANGDPAVVNGSESGGNAAANPGANANGDSTAPVGLDAWGTYLAMSATDQHAELTLKLQPALGDTAKLKGLYDWFYDERIRVTTAGKLARERIAKEAIKIDQDVDWAQEGIGKKNAQALVKLCIDECLYAMDNANKNEKALLAAMEDLDKDSWVDPARFAELQVIVNHVREREKQLRDNPRLRQAEDMMNFIRKNDLFKDLKFIFRFDDPYVIFQNYEDEDLRDKGFDPKLVAEREAKAAKYAKRDGIVFNELNRRYRELFADKFSLPSLETEAGGDRILRAVILWDANLLQKWLAAQKDNAPPGARAWYSPTEKLITHYVGQDSLTEQNFFKAKGGFVQPYADQVTFHEGTHQLMHEYGAIYQGKPLTDGVDFVQPRKSMWFGEGIAEFMGAAEVDEEHFLDFEGATFRHNRILIERTDLMRMYRRRNPEWRKQSFTLPRMLEPNHNGDLSRIGNEIAPGRGNLLANVFYAQAWAFVHFAYFYDNGKYRDNILEYMRHELAGTNGPDALVSAFKLKSKNDFGKVGDEYWWYLDQVCNRRTERDSLTRERPAVDTSVPEGNMESDDDDPWDDEDMEDEDEDK